KFFQAPYAHPLALTGGCAPGAKTAHPPGGRGWQRASQTKPKRPRPKRRRLKRKPREKKPGERASGERAEKFTSGGRRGTASPTPNLLDSNNHPGWTINPINTGDPTPWPA